MENNRNQLTFIDLFAGCGGLSLGLVNSKWKGLFAIERNSDAFETFKSNFLDTQIKKNKFDWPSWLPQNNIDISDLLEKYPKEIRKLRGKVDLIAGGPPCQGFSYAGKRNKNDPRNLLVEKYLELVKLVRPRFILIENVSGIAVGHGRRREKNSSSLTCGDSTADKVIQTLQKNLRYSAYTEKLNAINFGVPQSRERFFIIGINKGYPLGKDVKNPFDEVKQERIRFLKRKKLHGSKHVTVGDAISDLAICKKVKDVDYPRFYRICYEPKGELSTYQKIMRGKLNGTQPCSLRLANHKESTKLQFQSIRNHCEPGKSLSDQHRQKLGIKKLSTRVLSKKLPSGTITTLPDDQLHYSQNRILTVREQARLQAFPDWFVFKGKYTTGGSQRKIECPRYTQVGNAVPPFLAEVIGGALRKIK